MGNEPETSGPAPGRSSGEAPGPTSSAGKGRSGPKYQEKHKHIQGRGLISSAALGLTDGLVTNLSFLTGLGGAVSGIDLIRIAGLAAMIAGAVSMFFGGILGARSEYDLFKADSDREAYEIDHEREEEIMELKSLYREKGLTEAEANMVVARVSSDRERFLEDMLANELHIHRAELQSPYRVGAVIGLSFLLGALMPLLPYYAFSAREYAVAGSVILSLVFLFAAGSWKGRIAKRTYWKSGLETLLIGAAATALLYVIGTLVGFV
jgi:vacuolar iron transporter family protein